MRVVYVECMNVLYETHLASQEESGCLNELQQLLTVSFPMHDFDVSQQIYLLIMDEVLGTWTQTHTNNNQLEADQSSLSMK